MYTYNVWTQFFSAQSFRSVLAILLLFIHTASAHALVNQKGTNPVIYTATSGDAHGTVLSGSIT